MSDAGVVRDSDGLLSSRGKYARELDIDDCIIRRKRLEYRVSRSVHVFSSFSSTSKPCPDLSKRVVFDQAHRQVHIIASALLLKSEIAFGTNIEMLPLSSIFKVAGGPCSPCQFIECQCFCHQDGRQGEESVRIDRGPTTDHRDLPTLDVAIMKIYTNANDVLH